jgi:hypothetical protein
VTLNTGVLYKFGHDWQFDFGSNFGVTRASDRVNPFVGLSKRFSAASNPAPDVRFRSLAEIAAVMESLPPSANTGHPRSLVTNRINYATWASRIGGGRCPHELGE